ncbi:hypothetical protein TTHERM_00884570 (macronuclear) [Tetrahymena thermophila SB210]|uniref:Uncharacterized protein n=1 Tax=Tetrahymena thermophila (strain SB210) TaxID=312017 RepID=Q23A20_TETTS|nr:hypothetical protein TTHERM_00884570 [Tetrahymena thermophila SB210]EAR93343.1 hypothetical protein TTHERM_00884570 [Tetrahymena thermophila SB210]|eukprot:XP_001013588.1 hypothetical protein TTHERM_00884570 [Tetrahymena thermophila SB210]
MDIKECRRQKFSKNIVQQGQSLVFRHDRTYIRRQCPCCVDPSIDEKKNLISKIRSNLEKNIKKQPYALIEVIL